MEKEFEFRGKRKTVDDETFEEFCEWVSEYSVDQANHMDAYGFIHE